MQENTVFSTLNAINCNEHTERKGSLTYLSWAWAWQMVKTHFPDATYTIYENPEGWNYFTDGRTCWVKTGVTIQGLEHIEYLPVMDNSNKSIPLPDVKSFDVNKAIQRSLTNKEALLRESPHSPGSLQPTSHLGDNNSSIISNKPLKQHHHGN